MTRITQIRWLIGLVICFGSVGNYELCLGQPANDNCVTAQPVIIPAGGTICVNSTSLAATSSNTTNGCTPVVVNEVWFSFITAGPTNVVTITPNGGTPIQQPVVTLSDVGCGSGTYNSCDAAVAAGGTASTTWAYGVGTQVNVSVAGIMGDGTFEICITSNSPPGGTNSDCAAALNNPTCDPSPFTINSTAGNPSSGVQPSCFNLGPVQNDTWYPFTVGQTGTFEFVGTVINGPAEIDWAIYDITNGCPGSGGVEVACNYFFSNGNTQNFGVFPGGNNLLNEGVAPFNVIAGNTYAVMVDNFDNNGAGFNFTWGGTFLMGPTTDFTVNTPTGCNSVTTTFTNNTVGAATYNWTFGNGNSSTLQNPPAQTYNTPGTYFVTLVATSGSGCIDTYTASVEVFPEPTLNFTETPETCTGACDGQIQVNPSGNGPFTYAWTGGGATNSITDCAGNYSVTVTDQSNGCTATGSGDILAGGSSLDATINIPTPAPPYCQLDAPIQLTTVDGGGTFSGPGVNATGLFTPGAANLGINTITYTIPGSCGDVQTLNIEVQEELDATIATPPMTFCEGDPALQLTAASTGGTWTGTGVDATGLFTPANAGAGVWTITYTTAGACPNTDQVQLTVNAGGAPTITAPSTNPMCVSDGPVQLTADIAGGTWGGTGVDASGVFSPGAAGAGTWPITYTLPAPCGGTATWNAVVSEVTFTYLITEPLCNGGLDGEISFTTVNGGVPNYSFSTDGGTNWSTTWPATGLGAGAIQLIVRDFYGCESAVSLDNIGEPPAIVPQTSVVPSNCGQPNGEASVTATGGTVAADYTYLWDDPSAQTTATAVGLIPNNGSFPVYTVLVTDDNGCSASATAIIGSIGGFTSEISDTTDISCNGLCDGASTVSLSPGVVGNPTYTWLDINGLPAGNSQTVTGLCPGTYTLTVVDQDNCQSTNTIVITEPDLLVASVSGPSVICTGEAVQLSASETGGTPGFLYDWSVLPTDPGFINSNGESQTIVGTSTSDYTVEVTDLNGCVANATYTVTVLPPLMLTVDSVPPVCPGTNATMTFSANGGNGNYTFGWSLDGSVINSPAVTPLSINDQLTLQINVTDGCTQPNASETVVIGTIPPPEIHPIPNGALCAPTEITFSVESHPDVVNYLWEFNDPHDDPDTPSVSGPLLLQASHYYTEPGLYQPSLQVTTTNGCVYAYIQDVEFTIEPSPVADYISIPGDSVAVDFLDPTVLFEELTSGASSFEFSFGDSTYSTDSPIEHLYQDSGRFQVYLVAYNQEGCSDTAFGEVRVIPHYAFWVPTAFTPNGDGINDVFKAEAYGLTYMRMDIFNRWGEKVRVLDKIDDVWDGTAYGTGTRCQNGSYSYFAVTRDVRGIEHKYNGNVMLIGAD